MNINTLSAAQVEHKSNEVPFALYKNNFADSEPSYFARVINQGTCTDEDLACDIITAGLSGGLTKEKLLEVASLFRNARIARILTGCTVDDGITSCGLSLSGKFLSQNDTFSPERHAVSLGCRASTRLKPVLQSVTPVIRRGNVILPAITEVLDLESRGAQTLTRNGFLEVKGVNLTVTGDNEDVGLYFVCTEDDSKTVRLGTEKIGRNEPSTLCCVVPAELEEGTYRIMVRTQYLSGKNLSKETKAFTYGQELRVS